IQQRSVVLNNLKTTIALAGSQETRYQRLLRFVQFLLPEEMYLKFALHVLGTDELTLILDRTNWKLGKRDVNILMLSAVWEGFSLPLMWRFLPHGGSSDQRIRKELMADFLRHCPHVRINGLLADREFIGQDWFTFLSEHGIVPCIRLRSDTKMDGLPVHVFAKKMQVGEVRVWHSSMVVYGVRLRVLALKVSKTEMLYLAYKGRADQNLRKYALRWQCENLHAALKTRGFDLEATGLTQAERVSTLLMVIAISNTLVSPNRCGSAA
ncbi:IS4 family transposase, partial [Deinococcus radiophilus]|uniref:IS4 family transposase n=1 Tax=Deinococcus radiophilus TaxID=32062 RepID=UPI001F449D6B